MYTQYKTKAAADSLSLAMNVRQAEQQLIRNSLKISWGDKHSPHLQKVGQLH